ncbi:S41 family peptidase, partial [candidate division KSB1 bacterium]|nr:S41 family peptidase [candidate division KSB1 bacterium]
DGHNTSHIAEEINRNFWMLYHYLESPDHFNLKIRTASSKTITAVAIDALESKTVANAMAMRQMNPQASTPDPMPVSLTIKNKVGILTIQSFNYPDPELYKKKLIDCFKQIEQDKIRYLAVDLRGNTGGYPELAADLLTYFISAPVPYLKEPEAERYAALLSPQQPKAARFNGNAYFLCDGNSLSSSGHFLALVKYHHLGTIVGEIPGGTFYCNDESKLFDLPNSGLQAAVAQTTLMVYLEGYQMGDEIVPDFVVKSSIADILKNHDPVMAFVMERSK